MEAGDKTRRSARWKSDGGIAVTLTARHDRASFRVFVEPGNDSFGFNSGRSSRSRADQVEAFGGCYLETIQC